MSATSLTAGTQPERAHHAPRRLPYWLGATALAALGAVVYLALDPQSPDLAAASYRSHLFSIEGLTLWDNSWYGGHHLLAYSLLAPALGALIGPSLLAAVSMVAATALFAVILRGRVPDRAALAASVWFAFGAAVALLSSRVPFDLGLAVGLAAVALAQRSSPAGLPGARRRAAGASVLAVLSSLASPVAGAFLAMAMLAWALTARRRRERLLAAALCVLALAPIALLTLAFPEGGSQPFVASAFWPALAGTIAIGLLIPARERTLRIGALLYAVVLIGSFLVPSAVGGNADRLGALAAGPIAAAALLGVDRRRTLALLVLLAPLVYWQANAPVTDFVSTVGNRATRASYYAPLLAELKRLDVGYGRRAARIEVVPTVDHWEARYVAPAVMIARGWERQLDRYRNGIFYSSKPLTPLRYRAWLRAQGIQLVALPDASLDYSGKAEARIVEEAASTSSGPDGFLREIWSSRHWRLFAVRRASPLVTSSFLGERLSFAGAARILQVGRTWFALRANQAGEYLVKLRYSPYWAVTSGDGCVAESEEGWTMVRAKRPGPLRVSIRFSIGRVFSHGERCG